MGSARQRRTSYHRTVKKALLAFSAFTAAALAIIALSSYLGGGRIQAMATIEVARPPEKISPLVDSGALMSVQLADARIALQTRYELTDLGGGRTRVTALAATSVSGALSRVLAPLIRREAQRRLASDLRRVKTIAESRP